MIDDLHRLTRMHRHDDVTWAFLEDGTIELRPCWPDGRADDELDLLCRQLGFESLGNGVWRVALTSPHYEDLWYFVEQDRLEDQRG